MRKKRPPVGKERTLTYRHLGDNLTDILNRAHFLGLRDVILYERVNGRVTYSIKQIQSFSREHRWLTLEDCRFSDTAQTYRREYKALEVDGELEVKEVVSSNWLKIPTPKLIAEMMESAAKADFDSQSAHLLLEEAAASYPGCKVIYDPFGFRDLVYVLGVSEMPFHAKVGRTKNALKQRLGMLQTGSVFDLKPMLVTNKVTESYVHRALKDYRKPGTEWFDLEPLAEEGNWKFPLHVVEDIVNGV